MPLRHFHSDSSLWAARTTLQWELEGMSVTTAASMLAREDMQPQNLCKFNMRILEQAQIPTTSY
jgi:hypothetical protein